VLLLSQQFYYGLIFAYLGGIIEALYPKLIYSIFFDKNSIINEIVWMSFIVSKVLFLALRRNDLLKWVIFLGVIDVMFLHSCLQIEKYSSPFVCPQSLQILSDLYQNNQNFGMDYT
jgi:hypothetical protein